MKDDANYNETMEEILEYSMLYDFYGALLKEKNIEVFEDYVFNDMSLSEIAAEQGMTRQGVRDIVVRCRQKLVDYENRLGLVKSFKEIKDNISYISNRTGMMRKVVDEGLLSDSDEETITKIKAELSCYFDMIDKFSDDIVENL